MKHCVNCRHYVAPKSWWLKMTAGSLCGYSSARDLVTGELSKSCEYMRSHTYEDGCRLDAVHFELKPESTMSGAMMMSKAWAPGLAGMPVSDFRGVDKDNVSGQPSPEKIYASIPGNAGIQSCLPDQSKEKDNP